MNSVKFKPFSNETDRQTDRERERERERERVNIESLIPFDTNFFTAVPLDINYNRGRQAYERGLICYA